MPEGERATKSNLLSLKTYSSKPPLSETTPSPFSCFSSILHARKLHPLSTTLTLGRPSLELSSHGKNLRLAQQTPTPNYQFLQHQQQMKQQGEVIYRRSNSGISLNVDSSSCTPTMSSTRSFISSLSMDGSVANLDGRTFHLISAARSADQASFHHKRRCSGRGEDGTGSVKCGAVVDAVALRRGSTG